MQQNYLSRELINREMTVLFQFLKFTQTPHAINRNPIKGKVEKKYVNEFTARRNEKRPNQYSKEAQTKREKLAKLKQEEYAEKRERKIQEKATKV